MLKNQLPLNPYFGTLTLTVVELDCRRGLSPGVASPRKGDDGITGSLDGTAAVSDCRNASILSGGRFCLLLAEGFVKKDRRDLCVLGVFEPDFGVFRGD